MAAIIGVLMLGCDTGSSPTRRPPTLPPQASHIHNVFVNGICTHPGCYMIAMRQLPGGTLTRRGEPEGELHTITLSGFNMMVFEVTQELFYEVMGHKPSHFGDNPADGEMQGRRPVESVMWFDAVEFANKLSDRHNRTPVYTITNRVPESGHPITSADVEVDWAANGYRLPTEAEWEYANRAGSNPAWYWHFGNNEAALGIYSWYGVPPDQGGMTRQVGQKRANAWGLYDTHGNVWEWVWDWHATPFPNPEDLNNPRGPGAGGSRVVRGGSFVSAADDTHSAIRIGGPPVRFHNLGFRLVRP